MMARLQTYNGFDWRRVAWGKPDAPPRPLCAYCAGALCDDEGTLMIWDAAGASARICDRCLKSYFQPCDA